MIDHWLIDAIRANDVGRCVLAIEFGADIAATRWSGLTPLHLAAIHKSQAVFDYLLETGWLALLNPTQLSDGEKQRQHSTPQIVRKANIRVNAALAIYEQRIFSSICSFKSIDEARLSARSTKAVIDAAENPLETCRGRSANQSDLTNQRSSKS